MGIFVIQLVYGENVFSHQRLDGLKDKEGTWGHIAVPSYLLFYRLAQQAVDMAPVKGNKIMRGQH